jgi:type II restriction enzyme
MDGVIHSKADVRRLFKNSEQLGALKPENRGWTTLALNAVRKIGKREIRLDEVYAFEGEMHAAYSQNSHVRDKIQQQMQVLRDLGYLEFVGRGEYRVVQ